MISIAEDHASVIVKRLRANTIRRNTLWRGEHKNHHSMITECVISISFLIVQPPE